MRIMPWPVAALFVASFATLATVKEIDWKKVDDAFGRKPVVSDDVHRYGFPRTDLTVMLDEVTIKPALALAGWVAFKPTHGELMVMGDLVLLENEIDPVMLKDDRRRARNHRGSQSPASREPRDIYMHIGGHGDPAKMAAVIHDALAVQQDPTDDAHPQPRLRPRSISIPLNSIRSSGSRATRTGASISSTRCAVNPVTDTECQ